MVIFSLSTFADSACCTLIRSWVVSCTEPGHKEEGGETLVCRRRHRNTVEYRWRTSPTCLKQFGALLLTLLQTLSQAVDDSRSLELLFFSLVFQALQLLS